MIKEKRYKYINDLIDENDYNKITYNLSLPLSVILNGILDILTFPILIIDFILHNIWIKEILSNDAQVRTLSELF